MQGKHDTGGDPVFGLGVSKGSICRSTADADAAHV